MSFVAAARDATDLLRELAVFRDGQVLHAGDLRREDIYRHRALQQHQMQLHSAGIVCGLWLQRAGSIFQLTPGMAVDGKGRTILVPQTVALEELPMSGLAEVWISFRECPDDGDAAETPESLPDRYTSSYRIQLREYGACLHDDGSDVYLGTVYDAERLKEFPQGEDARPAAASDLRSVRDQHRQQAADSDDSDDSDASVDLSGRVTSRAIGGSIHAASRTSRLLLGPDKPLDPRLFAVGTRATQSGAYHDHLAIEAGDVMHLRSPSQMNLKGSQKNPNGKKSGSSEKSEKNKKSPAAIQLGYRHFEFGPADFPAPNHLADVLLNRLPAGLFQAVAAALDDRYLKQSAIVKRLLGQPMLSECECRALATRLCSWFNSLLARAVAEDKSVDEVFNQPVQSFLAHSPHLRSGTIVLLNEQKQKSSRRQPAQLMRLLLEDLFHPLIRKADVAAAKKRVLEFRGANPPPDGPRPGCLYLAEVTVDDRTHEELRLEIQHPGEDGSPEKYKAVVLTQEAVPPEEESSKEGSQAESFCLSIDASLTVTANCLKVFHKRCAQQRVVPLHAMKSCGFGHGLILISDPSKEEDQQAENEAENLAKVAPWDLVVTDMQLVRADAQKRFRVMAKLKNTGKGEIIGVQLHAVVFPESGDQEPIRHTVLREFTLKPGETINFTDGDADAIKLEIPYQGVSWFNQNLKAHLLAVGVGPGGVIAQTTFTSTLRAPQP